MELVNGSLPFLHLSTECHCPPAQPLVDARDPNTCTQHPGNLPSRGEVERTNSLSHPAGDSNDLSRLTQWISAPGVAGVNITLNLTNSLYEVRGGRGRRRREGGRRRREGGRRVRGMTIFSFTRTCSSFSSLYNSAHLVLKQLFSRHLEMEGLIVQYSITLMIA